MTPQNLIASSSWFYPLCIFAVLHCFSTWPSRMISMVTKVKVTQSCLTLCNPMDCSVPDSSIHGILLARILEWVTIPFSRGSSQPRDWTQFSLIAGRFFTVWATSEAPKMVQTLTKCTQHVLSSYYMNQQSHTWAFITEMWKLTLTQYIGKYQYMNVLATLFIIEKLSLNMQKTGHSYVILIT